MKEIVIRLNAFRDKHNIRRGEFKQVQSRLAQLKKDKERLQDEQNLAREAVLLLDHAGQAAREMISRRFNEIVTYVLQSVLGEDYKFVTTLEIKRNTVWAQFQVLSHEYGEPANPIESRGGGVVDLVSFALRVVLLELYSPRIEGPLLLDEPMKHLDKQVHSMRAAELLNAIAERVQRQIILVTHDMTLAKEAETKAEL